MKIPDDQRKSRILDAINRGAIIAPKGSKAAAMTKDDMAAFIVDSGMGDAVLDQTASCGSGQRKRPRFWTALNPRHIRHNIKAL